MHLLLALFSQTSQQLNTKIRIRQELVPKLINSKRAKKKKKNLFGSGAVSGRLKKALILGCIPSPRLLRALVIRPHPLLPERGKRGNGGQLAGGGA